VNFPKQGDRLAMHYVGTLAADGSKFDSSRDRGKPFTFQIGVGQVIQGWDEGVMKSTCGAAARNPSQPATHTRPAVSVGEKARLLISADYGYGERGAGGAIPPNAELVFEVELLAINPDPENGGCALM
jgi:FK506-binding protein 1